MAFLGAFEDIVKQAEAMVAKMKSEVGNAISTAKGLATREAGEMESLGTEVEHNFQVRVSSFVQTIKVRIESHKFETGGAGETASRFPTDVEHAMRTFTSDLQTLFDKFKSDIHLIVTDSRQAIKDVSDKITPVTKDATPHVESVFKDFVSALKDFGSKAEALAVRASHSVRHEITVSADFVHKHGVQIAEVAAVGVIQPTFFFALLVGGGMFYYGDHYQPSQTSSS
jgi:hypothetical protein